MTEDRNGGVNAFELSVIGELALIEKKGG